MKISHIIVTYNKEKFIASTLQSVLNQSDDSDSGENEIIVIDDNSTDKTVELVKEFNEKHPCIRLISDDKNKGPSIRFNEGSALASGEILHLIDGDDIVPKSYTSTMMNYIEQYNLDAVFGGWKKTDVSGEELLSTEFKLNEQYQISDTPLDTVLADNQVRMGMLLKKSIYLESGGCDESVFIQDESLPLRYAVKAKRIMTVDEPVIYVPKGAEGLSSDKSQQHHDRFFAYYNVNTLFGSELSSQISWKLRQAMISSTWKSIRKQKISLTFLRVFLSYLMSKKFISSPSASSIKHCVSYFKQLGLTLRKPS